MKLAKLQSIMTPLRIRGFKNPNPKAKLVHSRDGSEKGRVLDGERICGLEGCRGIRIAVRWFRNLKITWPCTKSMVIRPDGQWQIL